MKIRLTEIIIVFLIPRMLLDLCLGKSALRHHDQKKTIINKPSKYVVDPKTPEEKTQLYHALVVKQREEMIPQPGQLRWHQVTFVEKKRVPFIVEVTSITIQWIIVFYSGRNICSNQREYLNNDQIKFIINSEMSSNSLSIYITYIDFINNLEDNIDLINKDNNEYIKLINNCLITICLY